MDAGAHKGIDYVNGNFGPTARVDSRLLQLRWFDHYLKGIDNGVDREPPVDIFITGDNKWRKEKEFPLARTKWTDFFIHSGGNANGGAKGGLNDGTLDTLPPKAEPADTFTYDPGKPTPYLIDARELELSLNEDYQKIHAMRTDLLAFTSAPFVKEMEITGPMSATLFAASDARDTDWNVMLLDVYPDGRVMRIQDGIARARFREGFDKPKMLTPGTAYEYHIDMWYTGIVIPAGHRLRVTVASAAFPKYDRNLNTGGDNERETKFVSAHQRVLHDSQHASRIRLPVIPR
jgi:putative CocE/NonD family hydrolase